MTITPLSAGFTQELIAFARARVGQPDRWDDLYELLPRLQLCLPGWDVGVTGNRPPDELETLRDVAVAILNGIYSRRVADPRSETPLMKERSSENVSKTVSRLRGLADELEKLLSSDPLEDKIRREEETYRDIQQRIVAAGSPEGKDLSGETDALERDLKAQIRKLDELHRLREARHHLLLDAAGADVSFSNYICIRKSG